VHLFYCMQSEKFKSVRFVALCTNYVLTIKMFFIQREKKLKT
jgi:hypothetical protein